MEVRTAVSYQIARTHDCQTDEEDDLFFFRTNGVRFSYHFR
jgi:hypothetical protein